MEVEEAVSLWVCEPDELEAHPFWVSSQLPLCSA